LKPFDSLVDDPLLTFLKKGLVDLEFDEVFISPHVHLDAHLLLQTEVISIEFSLDSIEGPNMRNSLDSETVSMLHHLIEPIDCWIFHQCLVVSPFRFWRDSHVALIALKYQIC